MARRLPRVGVPWLRHGASGRFGGGWLTRVAYGTVSRVDGRRSGTEEMGLRGTLRAGLRGGSGAGVRGALE